MSVISRIKEEIAIIKARDPAMHSDWEVFLYPSFRAIVNYRVTHKLYLKGHFFLARYLSQRSARKTGIERKDVLGTIEAFMEVVKESLTNEENVYLRGFGSFIVKKRAQKTARNISKNTTIIIPEHNIPAFKPAKTFNISVKK